MHTESPKKILLIEDDYDIREVLCDILGGEGYEVDCAPNGREGLARLRDAQPLPDLCLLDRFLPEMSGDQVLEAMAASAQEKWAQVPVVLLSAAETPLALSRKPAGFLRKPIELNDLIAVVHRFCTHTLH